MTEDRLPTIRCRAELTPDKAAAFDEALSQAYVDAQIKRLCIAETSPADWKDFSGVPYPEDRAIQTFRKRFGVSIVDVKCEPMNRYEDDQGPVIEFTVSGAALFRGERHEDIGSAESKDAFFNSTDENKKVIRKPLSEISVGDVRRKAYTNLQGRLIRKALGLTFTWDELHSIWGQVGRKSTGVKSVSFRGKSQEGAGGTGSATQTKEAIHRMIVDIVREMEGDIPEAEFNARCKEMLVKLSSFEKPDENGKVITVRGKQHVEELSDKWAARLLPKVEKEWKVICSPPEEEPPEATEEEAHAREPD